MEDAATPPNFGHAVQSRDETPSGDRIAISTSEALVCLDRTGVELWRFDFGPSKGALGNARTNCRFSLDGSVVWLYRPDLYSGHGEIDRWFALDAATGAALGDAALPTYGGHGGYHVVHPDGVHVLLEVGCGQEGSYVFKGRVDDGVMACAPWPVADDAERSDQSIAALSLDGSQVMAFEHDGETISFIDFPSGDVQWQISLQDLGFDRETDQLETIFLWSGRYLDDRVAVIECKGETGEIDEYEDDEDDEDEPEPEPEWKADGLGGWQDYRAYVAIDLQTRRVLGPAGADGAYTGEHPRFVPERG